MDKKTSNIFRIVVAIIFLVFGIIGVYNGVIGLLNAISKGFAISFGGVFKLAINGAMLIAGLLALLRCNKNVCIILSVILFIGFAVDAVTGLINNAGVLNVIFSAAEAVCSFLFIGCVDRTSTNKSIRKRRK